MKQNRIMSGLALAAAGWLAVAPGARAQTPARAILELERGGGRVDVMLLGREEDRVFYRRHDSPPGVSATYLLRDIQAGEFSIDVFEAEGLSRAAARERRWDDAANLLLARVHPAMPYLDIPDNNALEHVLQAAEYLLISARAHGRRRGDANRELANRMYVSAFQTLRAAGRAQWHPMGEVAHLRAILCLIELGRIDDAQRALNDVRKPSRGDAAFGVYGLVEAKLIFARGDSRRALDVLIPSLLYENKDIGVFPEALMFSAQLYEDILEVHRTRDVYYEVARLFPGTEWQSEALWRLGNIHDFKMTQEVEDVDVLQVFFGVDEDMDETVAKFLEERRSAQDVKK